MNRNHRSFAGPAEQFDLISAHQFQLLAKLGLREYHLVLDIRCGPLGLGRLLIPFLRPNGYFGVEPRQSLIEDGVRFELSHGLLDLKRPQFVTSPDYSFREFGVRFDFLMAHAVFSHSPAHHILDCLRAAARVLQPDGLLLASWMAGPGNYEGSESSPALPVEYTESKIRSLAREAGLGFQVLAFPHPAGQSWAAFFLPGCQSVPKDPAPCPVLSSLHVAAERQSGYVDFAYDVGDYLLIAGWGIDPETLEPASQILITNAANGATAIIGVDQFRPDAAAANGKQATWSGFRALVRKDLLGDLANVCCYAVIPQKNQAHLLAGALPRT
jgi:SAM-dependent methyltransferase